jgi:N,N'-diacetyllegionaminate synthase
VVRVADRLIGPGQPCFLVAEVGINHNGDLKLAHKLIDAAADAGADAVKFQNYHTEDFLTNKSLMYEYVSQGRTVVESQYEMFKRNELSHEGISQLSAHCRERNVIFFATPTSEAGIQELLSLGAPVLKNGSDYLVHLDLIRAMARTGLPCIISTGMATLEEIEDAVRTFREAAGRELILLVCTSLYPTPPQEVNIRRIAALGSKFDVPVGLSDHTEGITAALGAVALGACMVEKHLTLDRDMPGPDHRFSADPQELKTLVKSVRTLEKDLGKPDIGPTPSEIPLRKEFRLSCVARRDLQAGHVISSSDITLSRPGTGMPPKNQKWLIDRRLVKDVRAGHPFVPEDFAKT